MRARKTGRTDVFAETGRGKNRNSSMKIENMAA